MIRTFRYPLRPTVAQESMLTRWLAACCELYNGALEHRREAWRRQGVNVSRIDQQKELTQLRAADPEWAAVPAWVERSALSRLDRAYRGFLRRAKTGVKPGFPRFRSSRRYDSFDLPAAPVGARTVRVLGDHVVLPKIGPIRFHEYRAMRGEVRCVHVNRTPRGWSISFVCDVGAAPEKSPVRAAIGVDMGLEAFATLSNGERVENPRFGRLSAETLARHQRALAKKRRGSAAREVAIRLVARAYEHVRNQRLDFARKLACALFSRFDLIVHEDLAISRMVYGSLAKSIYDASWGTFLRCLALKAENAGRHAIAVDPRGTSQACAACGTVAKKTFKERQHACSSCGFSAHRDHNAALVILGRGLRPGLLTEADRTAEQNKTGRS